MDITGVTVAKTAIDLAKTDNVLNKAKLRNIIWR